MASPIPHPRIVITGYRSFPGVPDNPSQRLIEHLATVPSGAETHLIETEYAQVQPRLDAILMTEPDVLVLTGYSAVARGFKLERQASDICSPRFADASGFKPDPGQAAGRWVPNLAVDFQVLEATLIAAGHPCHLSDNAGEFVCNHSYYHALSHIAASGSNTRAIFLHVPAIAGTPLAKSAASAMDLDAMASGTLLVTEALAETS